MQESEKQQWLIGCSRITTTNWVKKANYSRLQKHVIAYHIGNGKSAAKEIYLKVKN